jgi:hypothetical protein
LRVECRVGLGWQLENSYFVGTAQLRPVHPTAADVGRRVRVVSNKQTPSAWNQGCPPPVGMEGEYSRCSGGAGCVTGGGFQYAVSDPDLMLLADAPAEQPVCETCGGRKEYAIQNRDNKYLNPPTIIPCPDCAPAEQPATDLRAKVDAEMRPITKCSPREWLLQCGVLAAFNAQAEPRGLDSNPEWKLGHGWGIKDQRAATRADVATALEIQEEK